MERTTSRTSGGWVSSGGWSAMSLAAGNGLSVTFGPLTALGWRRLARSWPSDASRLPVGFRDRLARLETEAWSPRASAPGWLRLFLARMLNLPVIERSASVFFFRFGNELWHLDPDFIHERQELGGRHDVVNTRVRVNRLGIVQNLHAEKD